MKGSYTNGISEKIVCGPGYGYPDCNQLVADIYGSDRVFVPAADGILTDVNRAKAANWGISAYGALDWKASPDFTIGAGARYTWDHKRFDLDVPQVASTLGNVWLSTYYTGGYVRAAQAWDGVSPRVYARWAPNHDWTIYLSATKAMKAGGFGTFSLVASEPLDDYDLVPAGTKPDDYGKETVRSVELGVKGRLPDGRGTAAITAFTTSTTTCRPTSSIRCSAVRRSSISVGSGAPALRRRRRCGLAVTSVWRSPAPGRVRLRPAIAAARFPTAVV
ncbi:TonB-dependent receptor [Sphingomonas aerolata]|uniref:TonB-dependent receptor n=1 Tax=Sphingomonas aerolata TaxID=185951 RepID=UPI002FE14136